MSWWARVVVRWQRWRWWSGRSNRVPYTRERLQMFIADERHR